MSHLSHKSNSRTAAEKDGVKGHTQPRLFGRNKIISGFYGVAALVAERDWLYLFTYVITADLDHIKEGFFFKYQLLSISDLKKRQNSGCPL